MFAVLAGLCWLSARLARLMTAQATSARATNAQAAGSQAGPAGTGLLIRALPYLTVVIAAFAPLAAGIYLVTSLAWSLGERMLFRRSTDAGPLSAPATASRGRRFPPERSS